jgi:hypothetical protein
MTKNEKFLVSTAFVTMLNFEKKISNIPWTFPFFDRKPRYNRGPNVTAMYARNIWTFPPNFGKNPAGGSEIVYIHMKNYEIIVNIVLFLPENLVDNRAKCSIIPVTY